MTAKGIEVIIYELVLSDLTFFNSRGLASVEGTKAEADVILCNRVHPDIGDIA